MGRMWAGHPCRTKGGAVLRHANDNRLTKWAYYNEFDPYAAQWLRNLIAAGHIALGEVDERSIEDVHADDLKGFTQCHFFAGIGGWSLAARLAGWSDERPLWTGSAPCQPFSTAGNKKGQEDERHLWPKFFELIRAAKPSTIMGEQVSAAIKFGWLDGVSTDLEGEGYTCGAVIIPACAVNAPHRRERLWFVASCMGNTEHNGQLASPQYRSNGEAIQHNAQGKNSACKPKRTGSFWDVSGSINCPDGKARRVEPSIRLLAHGIPARVGRLRAYGNAIVPQVAAEIIKSYMEAQP